MIHADLLTTPGPATSASLDRPLDHLVACHQRIEEKLQVLERAALHLDDRLEEALYACQSVFKFLDSNGLLHTEDEEKSVFPRIRPHATKTEREYLDSLEAQHTLVEACLTRVKGCAKSLEHELDKKGPRAALVTSIYELTGMYRAHIASENDALIAIGRRYLDAVALAEIAFEMRVRRAQ